MPIVNGAYQAPTWVNGSTPAITATELQAMCNTLEQVPIANGGTGATTASQALQNLGGLPASGGTVNGNLSVTGNLSFGNIIPVTNGGTGASTVAGARDALGLGNTTGALPIANGGTGQTTAAGVRNALGLGNTTGALPIANGGTGATTAAGVRNALGLGNTTGDLPIANGGTGASSAATALSNLGGMPKTGGNFTGPVSFASTATMNGIMYLSGNNYGTSLPTTNLSTGRLFFLRV